MEGVEHRAVEVVGNDGRVAAVPCGVLVPRSLLAPTPPTSSSWLLLPLQPPSSSVPDHLALVVANIITVVL